MAIIQTTIAELRDPSSAAIVPNVSDIYYTTDPGQEGEWRYIGLQDIGWGNIDNTGTILNGNPEPPETKKYVFKRIYDGYVNVKWFGAKGDNFADDTTAIQSALNYISMAVPLFPATVESSWNRWIYGGGTLFFPQGVYVIKDTLIIGQHTKLLGISKGGDAYPYSSSYNTGSVIKCIFQNYNKWAIDSSCYWTFGTPNAGDNIESGGYVTGPDFDNGKVTTSTGIVIDSLIIDCGTGQDEERPGLFGGIRLNSSPNSIIRNCTIFNSSVSILLSSCWGTSVLDVYSVSYNYGIVVIQCNAISLFRNYLNGKGDQSINEIPKFVSDIDFGTLDLFEDKKSMGILIQASSSLNLDGNTIEKFNTGLFASWSTLDLNATYLEAILDYGMVFNGPVQANITQTRLIRLPFGFYVGSGPRLIINDVSISENVSQLYVTNNIVSGWRNIQFSQVRIFKAGIWWPPTIIPALPPISGHRIYNRDIIFVDEQVTSSIYIDGMEGNDNNYGFSAQDPVKTFDAALIRVQNQNTLNPVRTILLKRGTTVTKDLSFKVLENVDVLVKDYGEEQDYPILYFSGTGETPQVGQITLESNVNLCFRNIIISSVNNPVFESPVITNLALFGSNTVYAKLAFTFDVRPQTGNNIDLSDAYCLVQSTGVKSLLDIKFVNSLVSGWALSNNISGVPQNIAVDCIQVNSTNNTIAGWLSAQIIRNNF
ncbi:MAG: glycoside hydrolase family 55 protein [Bacteroidia bacterium]|jgi:parallel beta-helix repeat protein|nr:glycoside hydrolase family 55 protein [Bacteroidia bacterium]